MITKNVYTNVEKPLQMHEDARGVIADIFYNDNIHHVSIIKSNEGSIRGNHYHKETTQYMLITKGSLEYWYKPLNKEDKANFIVLKQGDFVETPPNEIHALRIIEENEFIVFTKGIRGGKDYEDDTIRIGYSIIED